MKALTLQQPWATLILEHGKDVENRTWTTGYRGPLLIHAGKGIDREAAQWWKHLDVASMPSGAIIARCELVDVVRDSPSIWAESDRFHWILADVEPVEFTLCRGKLGLWEYAPAREAVIA